MQVNKVDPTSIESLQAEVERLRLRVQQLQAVPELSQDAERHHIDGLESRNGLALELAGTPCDLTVHALLKRLNEVKQALVTGKEPERKSLIIT